MAGSPGPPQPVKPTARAVTRFWLGDSLLGLLLLPLVVHEVNSPNTPWARATASEPALRGTQVQRRMA